MCIFFNSIIINFINNIIPSRKVIFINYYIDFYFFLMRKVTNKCGSYF